MALTKTLTQSSTGSTTPWIVDQWANPAVFGGEVSVTSGSANYTIDGAYDDFKPQWDLVANTPTWYTVVDGSAGTAQRFDFQGAYTMLRLTVTSGTGTVVAKLRQGYAGRTT